MPVSSDIYNQSQFRAQPMATLADLADWTNQRKEQEALTAERQSLTTQRNLTLQKQQQEAEQAARDDQAIQAAFKKYTGPDGPDRKAIVNDLYRVSPTAAQKVDDAFSKSLKAAGEAHKAELEAQNLQSSQLAEMLQGATPDNYRRVFSVVAAKDPDYAQTFDLNPGAPFDPSKVQAALNAHTSRSDYNAAQLKILGEKKDAVETALEIAAITPDAAHYQRDVWEFAKAHQITDELRQRGLTEQFDPSVSQRAADLVRGVKGRDTLTQQQVVNDRQERQFEQSNAIARGNLAVAQGNLALRKQELNKPAGAEGGVKLSATAVEKIAGVDQSMGMIADIERALPSMLDNIGPYDGRKAGAKLATGVGVDQPLAEFAAQITGLKNAVIKATTGSAMSEPEAKRIMGQLPDLTQPETVFKARLETTKRNLELLKRRTIELSGGGEAAPAEATEKPVVKWGKDANGNPVRLP